MITFSCSSPLSPAVQAASGAPWGCVVRPMARRAPSRSVLRASAAPRCGRCYAYINRFCRFGYRAWVCSLCAESNATRGARYGSVRARDACAELRDTFVEFDDVESSDVQRARRAYVAVVDLAASVVELEAVKAALLAAVARLAPETHFGLIVFAERVGTYDLASALPHVVRRSGGGDASGLDARRAMSANARPLVRVGAPGSAARAAIGAALASLAPRGATRCFGDAVRAALALLALPRGERRGTLGSARLACFVAGATMRGGGAAGARRAALHRAALVERSTARPDDEEQLLEDELVAPDPACVVFWRAVADDAADCGVCVDVHALCNERAGAWTDLATLRVLSDATGGRVRRYAHDGTEASVARIARRLRGDLRKQLACREAATHCILRLRCSTGLGLDVVGGGGSGAANAGARRYVLGPGTPSREHPETVGLWSLAAADEHTALGFTFAFRAVAAGRVGFGASAAAAARAGDAPIVQLAVSFARPGAARRTLRVYTVRMALAATPAALLRSIDAPTLIALLAREAVATALLGGGRMNDARFRLHEWCLAFLAAAAAAAADEGEGEGLEAVAGGASASASRAGRGDALRWTRANLACFEARGGGGGAAAAEEISEPTLSRVPLLIYALLWHAALGRGTAPDARAASTVLVAALAPSALCDMLLPSLTAHSSAEDAAPVAVESLTMRAAVASGAPLLVLRALDAHIVFDAAAQGGHAPTGTPLRAAAALAAALDGGDDDDRLLTPSVLLASAGEGLCAAAAMQRFRRSLFEDGGESGSTFVQFEADLCAALNEDAAGDAYG